MNIVLIGMPGCGKTTIGGEIARLTGRKFVDVDSLIVKAAGMTVPEIFALYGEEGFRRYEREMTQEASRQIGAVIATGGGVVKDKRNYYPLHQTGYICQIHRDISLLPTDGRPLSQANSLQSIYEQRKPMYEFFRDSIVINDRTPSDAARDIINRFNRFRNRQHQIMYSGWGSAVAS